MVAVPGGRAIYRTDRPAVRRWFQSATRANQPYLLPDPERPPLSPGQRYTYDVRASWQESGKEVTQKQQIIVNAGSETTLIFANAPATK